MKIWLFLHLLSVYSLFGSLSTWSNPPTLLSTAGIDSTWAQIGMDGSGKLIAAWVEGDSIKTTQMPLAGSWSSLSTISSSGATGLKFAVSESGYAVAAWIANEEVVVSIYSPSGNWSAEAPLSDIGAQSQRVAIDASGNIAVVWIRNNNLESATKAVGSGDWQFETIVSTSAQSPSISIGEDGTVGVLWTDSNQIMATTKTLGGTWSAPVTISNANYLNCNGNLIIDANGTATAAWFGYRLLAGQPYDVSLYSASKISGGNWTSPIDLTDQSIRVPAEVLMRLDARGNIGALTNISMEKWTYVLQFIRKQAVGIWESSNYVSLNNAYPCNLDMATLPDGTVFIVNLSGQGFGSSMDIQVSQSSLTYWYNRLSPAQKISAGSWNAHPKITARSIDGTIYLGAVWSSFDGTNKMVYAATGTASIVQPPNMLGVSQVVHDLHVFTEYCNRITWESSPSPSLTGYAIFRNGFFVDLVTNDVLEYCDHNRIQGQSTVYGVAAVDSDYRQSAIVEVSYP